MGGGERQIAQELTVRYKAVRPGAGSGTGRTSGSEAAGLRGKDAAGPSHSRPEVWAPSSYGDSP